jgi:hypothetical protein
MRDGRQNQNGKCAHEGAFVFVDLSSGYQMGGVARTDKANLYFQRNEEVGEESRFPGA